MPMTPQESAALAFYSTEAHFFKQQHAFAINAQRELAAGNWKPHFLTVNGDGSWSYNVEGHNAEQQAQGAPQIAVNVVDEAQDEAAPQGQQDAPQQAEE